MGGDCAFEVAPDLNTTKHDLQANEALHIGGRSKIAVYSQRRPTMHGPSVRVDMPNHGLLDVRVRSYTHHYGIRHHDADAHRIASRQAPRGHAPQHRAGREGRSYNELVKAAVNIRGRKTVTVHGNARSASHGSLKRVEPHQKHAYIFERESANVVNQIAGDGGSDVASRHFRRHTSHFPSGNKNAWNGCTVESAA